MKRKKKLFVLLAVFYFAGLVVSAASLLFYHYYVHKENLMENTAENAMAFSETGKLATPDHMGMIYLVYDLDGHLLLEHLSGRNFGICDFDVGKYYSEIREGKSFFRYEMVEFAYNHSRSLVLVSGCPLKDGNKVTGMFLLIRDLENLRFYAVVFFVTLTVVCLAVCICLLYVNKREMELEAREKMYIADMNHELKSPITSIRALMETIMDGKVKDPEKLLCYYDMIMKETGRLEHTIKEILELSGLQNTGKFEKTIVRAEDIFAQPIGRYRQIAQDYELQFHAPDMGKIPPLYTNAKMMARVLDLLLHNAVKFTESGGEIWLELAVKREKLEIIVRDSGCGIPEAALPHIFERFYQGATAHDATGSGLGLSIVKEILEGLGERIEVHSREGEGTTFLFTAALAKKNLPE